MAARVFLTHQLPGERIHELARSCDLTVWMGPGLLSAAELRSQVADCEGLVCLLTDRIDRSLLDAAPGLRFVSSMSVGVDHVDVQALTERGIPLGHTPGIGVPSWLVVSGCCPRGTLGLLDPPCSLARDSRVPSP